MSVSLYFYIYYNMLHFILLASCSFFSFLFLLLFFPVFHYLFILCSILQILQMCFYKIKTDVSSFFLKKKPLKKIFQSDLCAICFQDGLMVSLDCNHHFHEECLKQWFRFGKTCPLCRQNVHTFSSDFSDDFWTEPMRVDTPFLEHHDFLVVDF